MQKILVSILMFLFPLALFAQASGGEIVVVAGTGDLVMHK